MIPTRQTIRCKPDMTAIRRAVVSSTAVETGQNVKALGQKLKERPQHRFAHIKLAA